ncbi:MAG TPA: adenylate/guanylate cyclase domain-containing protein [Gaiellaceae bacterium]|nr:adenylate/guanylate cyclase domain-containing protein [Gaiellaceae bacterium]
MRDLPTGTVTFLFTDIEGSTRLLEELGDRYPDLLGEHHRLIRESFRPRGGVEVDSSGDAFFVAFERPTDALAAAAAAQQALAGTGLRVRMGIHTGKPLVAEGSYIGMDVHRAARVMAAGHGGQVLVSEPTRELLDDGFELQDLGEHRLKDLREPLRLFQLGDDEFPPLRSLDQARIPSDLDPLVGRKRELGDLVRLLTRDAVRVVTLLGPGGIGKTRLATAAAQELVESYTDGVIFVDLAWIREPELVLSTIAEALGIEGDVLEEVGTRKQLLVLDNLEQVIDAAPDLARLLVAGPGLAVLATSREPLRIAGEHEFRLRPLAEAPAVELFRQRAVATRYDFEADYGLLAAICARLDNLPLAIELAAARIKVLSPEVLLSRLDRRLPLLTGARRGVPARHQTLRATIEWSYELLKPEEQRLFVRLAVFRGGWTVEAAEAVCDADLDALTSLVDKNLVREEGVRFGMLETIRELARERLREDPDFPELRRRHAEYYARLAETARPHLRGPGRVWLDRVEADHDNFRAALGWSLSDEGELDIALRVATSLRSFWHLRAHHAEGVRWLERALRATHSGVPPTTRAAGLNALGNLCFFEHEYQRAALYLEDSLALYREAGDLPCVLDVINSLGNATWALGDRRRTARLRDEALTLARQLRDSYGIARTLHYIGEEARDSGAQLRARRAFEESLEVMRGLGDHSFVLASLHGLGDLELDAGNVETAEARYRESLVLARDLNIPRTRASALAGLASTAAAAGRLLRAGRLWGAVESMEERQGTPILDFERRRYEAALQPHLSDPLFREGVAAGRGLAQADAEAEALSIDS